MANSTNGTGNPPSKLGGPSQYEIEQNQRRAFEEQERKDAEKFPLIHAMSTPFDQKCLTFLQKYKSKNGLADEWFKVNRIGNILHYASYRDQYHSLLWLLKNVDTDKVLRGGKDNNGETPLEALEHQLEQEREYSEEFTGYTPEAVQCLAILRGIEEPTEDQLAALKYGCSCGKCIDDFLSPRTKYVLLVHAEQTHDMLNMDMMHSQVWWDLHQDMLKPCSPAVRRDIKADIVVRQGFANVFKQIASVLRAGEAPTVKNVEVACTQEKPQTTRKFYHKGGRTESVLRVVFDLGRVHDEKTGDGSIMEMHGDEISSLPECRNDNDFQIVLRACKLRKFKGFLF